MFFLWVRGWNSSVAHVQTPSENSSAFGDGTRSDVSTRMQNPFLSASIFSKRFCSHESPRSIAQTWRQLLNRAIRVVVARDIRMKLSSVIHNYVCTEMKREILQQWQTMHALVYFKRPDKNRLWYIMRIWTTIFPWCAVLFARGRLSMESPVGVWYSIVPLCYLVCCACPPHPHCLQRTLIPFSVRPQRHIQHCLKCCKWDTEPHSPNKGGGKQ